MSEQPYTNSKVTVLLAGAGHEVVYYQMQQPVLADPRFMIAGYAAQWSMFETSLANLQPDLTIIQADIAPDAEALMRSLAKLSAWQGVAVVVLPQVHEELRGPLSKVDSVRGVFVAPVNWMEVASAGYGAAMTARARLSQTAPMQGAAPHREAYITGTKRIALLSHAPGAGCSTIAENLAYELAVRLRVKSLLVSMGLPPAAAAHLGLRYAPNLTQYFDRPGKAAFQAALQRKEALEVLLAPESSLEYLAILEQSGPENGQGTIYNMLMDSEDGRYAAILMDTPPAENLWLMHALLFANVALVVARPTLADLAAVRHSLTLLLNGLKAEKRLARESIYLVLNQVSERSSFTPRLFQEELGKALEWAPPIAAVIPFDPELSRAQDDGVLPVTRLDDFARGIRDIVNTLFPQVDSHPGKAAEKKGVLRLPRIRFT